MVKQVGITTGGNIKIFQGLSTDTKPIDGDEHYVRVGGLSSFYESDTGDVYIYDELNINPVTQDGWWK